MRAKLLIIGSLTLLALAPLAAGAQDIQLPQDFAEAPPVEELSPGMLVAAPAGVDAGAVPLGFLSEVPIWVTIIAVILILGWFSFNLWMFIHALVKPIRKKVMWLLLLFFFGPLAAVVYFFTGRKSADEVYLEAVPTSAPAPVPTPVSPLPLEDPGVRLGSVIQGYTPEPASQGEPVASPVLSTSIPGPTTPTLVNPLPPLPPQPPVLSAPPQS